MAALRTRRRAGVLALAAVMSGLLPASPANAEGSAASASSDRWQGLIAEAAQRFGVPEAWIRAVLRAESGGRTMLNGRPITSPAGAMGLMQLMPKTWDDLTRRYGLGADPYDPRANILAGAAYLAELDRRYGYPDLFAAYNAGPARFDAFAAGLAPLPGETTGYMARLGQTVPVPLGRGSRSAPSGLFFALGTASNAAFAPPRGRLFVLLANRP